MHIRSHVLFALILCGVSTTAAGQQGTSAIRGRIVDEQWIVEQHGDRVEGRVKTPRRDFPLEGTVIGNRIEVKVRTAEDRYNLFRGIVDRDSLKGTIEQKGDDGTFSATRSAADPK